MFERQKIYAFQFFFPILFAESSQKTWENAPLAPWALVMPLKGFPSSPKIGGEKAKISRALGLTLVRD